MAAVLSACGHDMAAPDPDGVVGEPAAVAPGGGHEASRDEEANVPTFLWAEPQAATSQAAPRPTDREGAARYHIARYASRYRLTPAQVASLALRDIHDTGRGAVIARFGRKIDGIEVLGEQISVAMDRSLELVALTGYVTGDMPAKQPGVRARSAFQVNAAGAMATAMADLSGAPLTAADFEAPRAQAGAYQTMEMRSPTARRMAAVGPDAQPVRGKQVFVRSKGVLRPAYFVEADLGKDPDRQRRAFSYVVAGDDGSVIQKHNLVAHQASPQANPVTYRVWADASGLNLPFDNPTGNDFTPHPTGVADRSEPDGEVASTLVTLSSLTQIGVNDPWLPPGATETRGNNADVYLDVSDPDGFTPGTGDRRGRITSAGRFDHSYDFNLDADASETNQDAGLTQLFYDNNWYHDWYYVAGFDEASGNAQQSNYGRGGLGGDPLLIEAQDSSGLNNAFALVFSEGRSPVITVFRWTRFDNKVTINAPSAFAGEFIDIATSTLTPKSFNETGELVRSNPANACAPLVGDVTGKIVLADRGTCAFAIKVANAQAAGAVGILIGNVATSLNAPIPTRNIDPANQLPAMSLGLADANRFRAAVAAGPVNVTMKSDLRILEGGLDNQINAHEWGHYISNRLVFDGFGLLNNISLGLGEGYADFHALLVTVRPEDVLNATNTQWQGVYGSAGYAPSDRANSYYFGVRRYPYSTRFEINPLTFKHISDVVPLPAFPQPAFDDVNSEVHNTGEVWTQMLWECYTALLRDTLGPAPRLTFAQARDRMRDYVVASYKLVPRLPTLLEARDALLAVAQINDPVDFKLFGQAFARRGAGSNAVSPPRGNVTNTPVVESFVFGPSIRQVGAVLVDDVTAQCNQNGLLDAGEVGTLRVTFRNVGSDTTPALFAQVTSQTPGVKVETGALQIPSIPRGGTVVATVRVGANSTLAPLSTIQLTVATPDPGAGEGPAPVVYTFAGNAEERPGISTIDTAERNQFVWTVTTSDPIITGAWRKEAATVNNRVYQADSSIFPGTTSMTSPPLQVVPNAPFTLAFNHRFSFDFNPFFFNFADGGIIEITSDGGATWTNLFDLGIEVPYNAFISGFLNPIAGQAGFAFQNDAYPAFEPVFINLGTQFGGQTVQLRLTVGSDVDLQSSGWEVDDIDIRGTSNLPFPGLVAKVCNLAPTANAGPDVTVVAGTRGVLQGSGVDPEGQNLTFQWTAPAGFRLENPRAATLRFTAPLVTSTRSFTLSLVVTDASGKASAPDTVVVTVNKNTLPVE